MAFDSVRNKPWPAQTALPQVPESSTSRRRRTSSADRRKRLSPQRRQATSVPDQTAIAQAERDCQFFSGNDVLSCYPLLNTTIHQNEWATFVWNSRLPQYAQKGTVNIYLFHGDSGEQVFSHLDYPNPTDRAGDITALVNDTWWGDRGRNWRGQDIPYLFYWVITPGSQPLGANYLPQATFTAIQTTYADSMLSTMSSTSSPSSSATGLSNSHLPSPTLKATGSVQNSSDNSSFPHWAIAVISVLGFLALLVSCVLVFLFCRMRRRRYSPHRDSVTSATPMMAENSGAPQSASPLLGAKGLATGEAARLATGGPSGIHEKATGDDGSLISRSNSAQESGLFSGADAAIMADAFRMALRKPEFMGGTPEENPEENTRKEAELLNKELAEEGRDIRSVSSSRVKVEGLSE
ncbi:hypothetical protein BDM02DRAFT_3184373 [Thelephora ganbajun]|uniref:Uncharacterized protein n=1 Tax=Thelephora ganbajun TaxID=370292 RepID=A0ACB6ZQ14_THEGA|nr:hypothetical protein BDM02DRAFT_3184373 [Thelephora ganbajun]